MHCYLQWLVKFDRSVERSQFLNVDQWLSENTCFSINCCFYTDYRYENKMVLFGVSRPLGSHSYVLVSFRKHFLTFVSLRKRSFADRLFVRSTLTRLFFHSFSHSPIFVFFVSSNAGSEGINYLLI